jgi:protein-S-isoprenylcysteine O-methyltransferase Ste14
VLAATVNFVLAAMWMVLILYWVISAFGVKRNSKTEMPSALSMVIRLSILIGGIVLLSSGLLNPLFDRLSTFFSHANSVLQVAGLILTAAGIAFAVWARAHLGRNWSSVPTLKEGHELVTTGPYRYVRNPIYTGVLFGMLGSALAGGLAYVLLFVLFLLLFVYRVYAEDQLMMRQFPDAYPEYRRKTKALVPFVA